MRRSLAVGGILLLVVLPLLAPAEAPRASIKGPRKVAADGTIVLDGRASVADRPLRWKLEGPDVPLLTLDQDGRKGVVALVPSAPAGVYKFTLIAVGTPPGEGTEIDADAAILVVTVENPEVAPVVPPSPVNPPSPVVPPVPSPITPGPMRAMIVYESSDAMTREQLNAIYSTSIAAYLNTHCVADQDGRFAWRIWDKDTDAGKESESWRAAWAAAKADPAPLPKLVIFAGQTVSRSFPITTEADTLATLQQFGGK